MKYMGSKSRVGRAIVNAILLDGDFDTWIEPFCGGLNITKYIDPGKRRIVADSNKYIATMWRCLLDGWIPPSNISRIEYDNIRSAMDDSPMTAWAGICCSYGGKWFGGYAGVVQTKGGERDYQDESLRNVLKQVELLRGCEVHHRSYDETPCIPGSVVYCDPPYANTTGYSNGFNSELFWDWCRKFSDNSRVYVSEYSAPDDFECIWESGVKSSLSANGRFGGSICSTERLFRKKKTLQPDTL